MSEKKNFILSLLSYITYKDKKTVKEFYIPEINENTDNKEEDSSDSVDTSKIQNENEKLYPSKRRCVKKPTPVSDAKRDKQGIAFDAKKDKQSTASDAKKGIQATGSDAKKGIQATASDAKKEGCDNQQNKNVHGAEKNKESLDDRFVSTDIERNKSYINRQFNAPENKDIIIREFIIAGHVKAFIAYIDGMVDKVIINNFILRPLLNNEKLEKQDSSCQLDFILTYVLETNQAKKIIEPKEAVYELLTGNTLLYVDGCDYYITNETKGFPARSVEKPQVEGVVTGAHEAFNESLRTNIALVRKIIKNSNLTTEFLKVGDINQSQCAIIYLKDIANPAIIAEVKRRIKSLDADFISGDGLLEQFIEDNPHSIIPTALSTERPDRTASHIMEGKVAVIIEGAPYSLIVPVSVYSFIHSPEDAFMRFPFGTALRFIRLFAIFVSVLLPGLYVALTNFHQEMIPTDLLLAIVKAKENVPFPTVVEVLLMEISFELIREAGIRIPGIIGNTLGIIGALILGQAAVQANIVSPVLIIVVAVTGLGNFAIPNYGFALALRFIRFAFILFGALIGFYGITIGIALFSAYFLSLKSFGTPMFAPVAPKTKKSSDVIIRYPPYKQELRPDYVNAANTIRQPEISRKWILRYSGTGHNRKEDGDD